MSMWLLQEGKNGSKSLFVREMMSKYEIQITMIVEKPEQVFFFFQQTQWTQEDSQIPWH